MLCIQSLSCAQLLVTQRTVAHQSPLSMGFPQQEYWSGLPFPPPQDLPNPRTEPEYPTSPVLHLQVAGFFAPEPSGKPHEWSISACNRECSLHLLTEENLS